MNKTIERKVMKIDELIPAAYNPRKDLKPEDPEYQMLKKSLDNFGYVQPIIMNKRTGHIVGGHQRIKILRDDFGLDEVEVNIVDLDDDQEKMLNLQLNNNQGEWDNERLKDLLEELDTGANDLDLTGFDEYHIESLMTQYHIPDDEPEFDESVADDVKKATCPECGHEFPI